MQRGQTNQTTTTLFVSMLYIFITFIGTAQFLYFYIFQVPSMFSSKRFLFSFACSGLLVGMFFGILLQQKKFLHSFKKINLPALFLQSFLFTCYFVFLIPQPANHLFSKQLTLHAEFNNDAQTAAPIEVLWINNGLREISYSDLQFDHGNIVENTAIHLFYNAQGRTSFTWEGSAWDTITIVARSNDPFTAIYDINGETHTFHYTPEVNQDFQMKIPVQTPAIKILVSLTVFFSSVIMFSLILFITKIASNTIRIKKLHIKLDQSVWHIALALPLAGILLYLIRIGFHNRLYADDYCYLTMVRKAGYFSAINIALRSITGRFMSHIADFFLFIWEDALVPYGMLISVLLLAGSLTVLFYQLIDGKNKRNRYLLSFIFSAVVVLSSFSLTPSIYESAFWNLHVWSVFGGAALFNIAIAIIIRSSQKAMNRQWFIITNLALLFLGFISCGFHENTGMLILLTSGVLWLIMTLFLRHHPLFRNAGTSLFLYLIGSLIGFLTIVFMPGEQERLSIINMSYGVDQIFLNIYQLTVVKLNVLYEGIHHWGFVIILCTGMIAFLMGKNVSVSPIFSQINIKKKAIASMLFLFPFILFVISFVPSTFIRNYYPNRTMIVPIYFFVLTFFMIAFIAGIQQKGKGSPAIDQIVSLFAGLALIILFTTHFIPIGNQFAQFANEWDRRDAEIRSNVAAGLTEMKVAPYQYNFGVDISTTNNLFLSNCYDEYYGIHVIPPD